VIADKQFLGSEITTEPNKELSKAEGTQQTETCPNDSQRKPVNEPHAQLASIRSLDLPNASNGGVACEPQKHCCVEKHDPPESPLGGEKSSSLFNDGLIGLSGMRHGDCFGEQFDLPAAS